MAGESKARGWKLLQTEIVTCERCPRLRAHCTNMATVKRAAFREQTYWGKPVPNLGDPNGRLLIVGLAPAAHGANRTGRLFTGDRSGDFLFEAMHAEGFCNQKESAAAGDGLELIDCAITGVAHCAPPDNKPLPEEIGACAEFLERTIGLMPRLEGIVCLGRIAFEAMVRFYRGRGWVRAGAPRPVFGHGALHVFSDAPFLLCAFHPSQQNTFTGRLTQPMLRAVFRAARGQLKSEAR